MTLNGFWRAFVPNTVFRKVFLSVLAYFEVAYFVAILGREYLFSNSFL